MIKRYPLPLIYLDTWSYDLFAFENKQLGDFFVRRMEEIKGVLAISDINVYEIVQRDDDIQISRICDFVNMIDVDFINTNIFDVIEKEKSLKNGTIGIIEPWRDYEMIERYNTFCGNSTHYDIKSFILKSREAYKTGLIKYQFASNFNPIIEKFRKINRFINNKGLKNFPCTEWLKIGRAHV